MKLLIGTVLLLALSGCASATLVPLEFQSVMIEVAPEPPAIPEGEDFALPIGGKEDCTKPGILLGVGKAARCKWYKIEFEKFSKLYRAEALARQAEHGVANDFSERVSEYVSRQESWWVKNQLWIGLTVGLLGGTLGTAFVMTR